MGYIVAAFLLIIGVFFSKRQLNRYRFSISL